MSEMDAKHPERFVYQIRITMNRATFEPENAEWIVFDRHNQSAAHFHGHLSKERSEWSEARAPLRAGRFAGLWFQPHGIELHRSKRPEHYQGDPLQRCGVLSGDCYPDGTSLGASRFAEWWSGDDASAFGEVRAWLVRDEPKEEIHP